jgi:hypothetical protein
MRFVSCVDQIGDKTQSEMKRAGGWKKIKKKFDFNIPSLLS